MSNLRFLDFQYNLSKKLPKKKPIRKWLSAGDRQIYSGLMQAFEPNSDEMRRAFDKIDRDGDGKISADDLRQLVEVLDPGNEDVEGEVSGMMWAAGADKDKGGFMGFREFVEVNRKVVASDIQRAFRVFDRDGDGRVGAEEVLEVMRKLDERCSLKDCRRMVSAVARSADGMVEMDDFMAMMTCTMKSL